MSQEVRNAALKEKTKTLLEGPLKHIRGAALAAALLPLASVAAAPAAAQNPGCASGGICGFVWNDANGNGIQDEGANSGIPNAKVYLCVICDGYDNLETETDADGFYYFYAASMVPDGTYTIGVKIPTGTQPAPANATTDVGDSDGQTVDNVFSVASVTLQGGVGVNADTDFGFVTTMALNPGTGTPGYWKNHPDAWPVDSISVGGVSYTKAQAISWLGKVGKDKTTTMFSSLVAAKLNVTIGNEGSCINGTIAQADAWMATYGPVGSNVQGSSYAWSMGEPLHQQMDAYNNGQLCAPHRN